ncbi:late competence development ComFB family protein [Christensenellaceae bacterium OttesenSCG-928-K19]|nr:late competence development ComFB family protein [Christensenellaceae bacterium OttesenSCG-928-K19]
MLEANKLLVANIMEEIVEAKLDIFMAQYDICKCDMCRADVLALALNKLPPKYVVSTSGDVYSRLQTTTTQMLAEITVALTSAVELVGKKPRHPLEESVK